MFRFCANASVTPPACFTVPGIAITGDVDISAQIQAAAAPLPITSLAQFLALNNNWTGLDTYTKQIISSVATGTAPFSIASTTVVPNLNAQLHNGKAAPAGNIVGDTDSQTLTNKTLTSPAISSPTTTGTDSGTETLTNKTLTSPTITTPVINGVPTGTGVAGTDSTLLSAGSMTGVTGAAVCKSANGGATTSGCTAGGVTEMTLSATVPSASSMTIACSEGGTGLCNETVFANAHTLVRLTYNLTQAPVTCSPNAVISVRDMTSASNLTTITVNQGSAQFVDSGALSIATTAGHKILVGPTTAAAACGTVPNVSNITAVFQ